MLHNLHATRPEDSFSTLASSGTTKLLADHGTENVVVALYYCITPASGRTRRPRPVPQSPPDLTLVLNLGGQTPFKPPGVRGDLPEASWARKEVVHILERQALGLGEQEVDQRNGKCADDSIHDVVVPADGDQSDGGDLGNDKVVDNCTW